jgi:SsrA-binding protein
MSKQKKKIPGAIANNRKALHDYGIIEHIEAGIVLEGWELKSIRAGKVQLRDSYVVFKDGEAWLLNTHISALSTVSTHKVVDPTRSRKLLLHKKELAKLRQGVQQEGNTLVPLNMHWRHSRVKIEIALARGKKQHDKRDSAKESEWQREQSKLLKKKI